MSVHGIGYRKTGQESIDKRLSAPEGVPRPSPTLVLTGPYDA